MKSNSQLSTLSIGKNFLLEATWANWVEIGEATLSAWHSFLIYKIGNSKSRLRSELVDMNLCPYFHALGSCDMKKIVTLGIERKKWTRPRVRMHACGTNVLVWRTCQEWKKGGSSCNHIKYLSWIKSVSVATIIQLQLFWRSFRTSVTYLSFVKLTWSFREVAKFHESCRAEKNRGSRFVVNDNLSFLFLLR